MSGWQPIETAPKTGWFLAYQDGCVFQLRWTEALAEVGGYISEPTHWMPLPEPPRTDDEPDAQNDA